MGKKEIRDRIEKQTKYYERSKQEMENLEILNDRQPGYIVLDKNETSSQLTQDVIKNHTDIATNEKAYKILLEDGIYHAKYDSTGRYTLLFENKGGLSMFDTKTKHLFFEEHVREKIQDAMFLHNELFIAVAQKKYLYIYDNSGREIQCHMNVKHAFKLDFLKYHFLCVSISHNNKLTYLDTSIGKIVAEIKTDLRNTCLAQNPKNAVMHLGNEQGSVTLWTPNNKEYVMKILCHDSSISNVAIDDLGSLMVTNGRDNQVKVWDIRNTYEPLNTITTKNNYGNMTISQTNKLAVSHKGNVEIWTDIDKQKNEGEYLYLKENFDHKIVTGMQFCPYEDILCVSNTRGMANMIVPGSGIANYDSFGDSPFRTKYQRRNAEVKQLLEKIPYDLIRYNNKDATLF